MGRQAFLEFAHSPDSPYRIKGKNDYRAHLDDELDEIGPENGPHPGTRRVCNGDDETNADRDDLSRDIPSEKTDVPESERDREDLDHRLRHPAKDDEVDRDGEVERTEPAQHCRRPTTVADLRKLDVGHDVSASPEAGGKKKKETYVHPK